MSPPPVRLQHMLLARCRIQQQTLLHTSNRLPDRLHWLSKCLSNRGVGHNVD
eukprot:CAMPEP_0197844770 /NCGR_PEP_ID=MMETSP1438-20131217/1755_1 /TAXON_ID=1461541 /ORGANISM="Pterosperma sp., Strain CCMP1384" /LENGTH=51 /DNA_ID=CAMNT_0043455735 /DNA_START=1 /DNA_END=156 /DNA_ORIENTATION=-